MADQTFVFRMGPKELARIRREQGLAVLMYPNVLFLHLQWLFLDYVLFVFAFSLTLEPLSAMVLSLAGIGVAVNTVVWILCYLFGPSSQFKSVPLGSTVTLTLGNEGLKWEWGGATVYARLQFVRAKNFGPDLAYIQVGCETKVISRSVMGDDAYKELRQRILHTRTTVEN